MMTHDTRSAFLGIALLIVGSACRTGPTPQPDTSATDPAERPVPAEAHPTLGTSVDRETRRAVGRAAAEQARLRRVRRENREIAERWRAEAPERLTPPVDQQREADDSPRR